MPFIKPNVKVKWQWLNDFKRDDNEINVHKTFHKYAIKTF